jgi:hypothetical protein
MNFEAMPVAGHPLRIAVAHAGGFLEASEARCSALTVAMRPWPPTPSEIEAAKATRPKGKWGQKRTNASLEADATEPKRKVALTLAPVPSPRVPVARMY